MVNGTVQGNRAVRNPILENQNSQCKKNSSNILMNEQQQIPNSTEEQLLKWKKYIKKFFIEQI